MIWEGHGIDAHKKVNGRKRQLLVDIGGRLWFATVHAVHLHDGAGALGFLPDIICQNEPKLKFTVIKRMQEFLQTKLKNLISNLKRQLGQNRQKVSFLSPNGGRLKEV